MPLLRGGPEKGHRDFSREHRGSGRGRPRRKDGAYRLGGPEAGQGDNVGGQVDEEVIRAVVEDLACLEATAEGAAVARLLKAKCRAETELEGYCTGIAGIKSQYTIHQRFYFFDGEPGLTLGESYHFLCHRWREKRQQERRQKTPGSIGDAGSGKKDPGGVKKHSPRGTKGKQ